jgi:hypothetical protein
VNEPEPQDDAGPGFWDRLYQREHDAQVRQLEESRRQDQLRSAMNEPFNPADWERQRALLGIDQRGLDGQTHGGLRRLS